MDPVIASLVAGFPYFMLHSSVTFALLVAAVTIYVWITPYKEFALIKEGNVAAAISLAGAILGLAIPLAFCMAASVAVLEIVIWGAVTLILQIIAFRIVDFFMSGISRRIQEGEVSAAIFLFSVKMAVAAVTSAAVGG
jgi:putative membrane protein